MNKVDRPNMADAYGIIDHDPREVCPECGGYGWVIVLSVGQGHGCDGDDRLCATVCPIPVPVQEQDACPTCGGSGEASDVPPEGQRDGGESGAERRLVPDTSDSPATAPGTSVHESAADDARSQGTT